MKIIVVGAGYVGLANAVMLAQYYCVTIIDIDKEKIECINARKSPIKDNSLAEVMSEKKLMLTATDTVNYQEADYVIIATPTDYDSELNYFDTSTVDNVIDDVLTQNNNATIIIKSTVPVGYTQSKREKYSVRHIIFSPEFLREGSALYDCTNPSRIIMGDDTSKSRRFVEMLLLCMGGENIKILYTGSNEAEAIKLFSNTYLAMRVAFFNELDTYAQVNNLNTHEIISGVGLDSRIGLHYNNPSFGYGGYCLPKDTKQLLANFNETPNTIIKAIVDSNEVRKNFITQLILREKPNVIGFYRLVMKFDSDNFRSSAVLDILENLRNFDVTILLYEPLLNVRIYRGFKVINDLNEFKKESNIIVANRLHPDLLDSMEKIFTRDLYQKDL